MQSLPVVQLDSKARKSHASSIIFASRHTSHVPDGCLFMMGSLVEAVASASLMLKHAV
ncbi:hypothetical protein DOTSEDRAFT_74032 [Dothistroma septosporum NZE10]|uniref:Uncharacterized protein n=1 Tax=Dothistroma septosporum (strain NZE10 / CBS 128990) TaxID=675120 RepID=N1PKK5_DOTSN|nr:hypothetical protein DOTSEDRAFT_74032 [Dothistroma septosporum NZE10]